MKINYDTLLTLDERSLENGLFAIYKNAKELNISAEILAKEEKYAMATALKLLSIEELIKAQSVFLFIIGVRNKEFIDVGFKKLKVHKNVHQTRLKIAEIFNSIKGILDAESIEKKILDIQVANPEKYELIDGETIESFIDRITASMPSVSELLQTELNLIEEQLEEIVNRDDNFLSQAQAIKEKCIYVDIDGTNWISPAEISNQIYLEASSNTDKVFSGITAVIERLMTDSEIKKKTTLHTLKNIFKNL